MVNQKKNFVVCITEHSTYFMVQVGDPSLPFLSKSNTYLAHLINKEEGIRVAKTSGVTLEKLSKDLNYEYKSVQTGIKS